MQMSSASTARAAAPIYSSDIEPDHQLQKTLESAAASRPPGHDSTRNYSSYSSRKHGWDTCHSSDESDLFSEISGQFDDAEEKSDEADEADESEFPLPDHPGIPVAASASAVDVNGSASPSSHSVKRRRSNDWPHQSVENVSAPTARKEQASSRQRWPFGRYYERHASSGSPRLARPTGRRSRFVEGHMNDTVSEKPPSIFFRDVEGQARGNEPAARAANRNSGIFRFGKAIASAFNPFGGWGSVSDIWKSSQVQDKPPEATNDRLRQAELAYEELKRAGYQGTTKGSYVQSLGSGTGSAGIPEETWKSIREKMEYGSVDASGNATAGGQHSRESSGQAPSNRDSRSGSSLLPMFPDLRKAKSSLAIKKSDGQEVRHQRSRKDMQRHAKLMKRVSNLEDKLDRARRELREISGEAEQLMPITVTEEKPYQRKFVPGALPSLPSERLLHDSERTTPLSPPPNGTLEAQGSEDLTQSQVRVNKTRLLSPKPWRKSSTETRCSSANSPSSRKRKSPGPESRKEPGSSTQQQQRPPDTTQVHEQGKENGTPDQPATATEPTPAPAPASTPVKVPKTPLRKPKLPKTARGDSPGSVERKQNQRRSPGVENSRSSPAEERTPTSRPLRSTTRNRSATPVLRMKRGRGDLRSTVSPGHDEDKENFHHDEQENDDDGVGGGDTPSKPAGHGQQQTMVTPTRTSSRKARYEYIPPVPPLPKDLAATAAKVDRRLAKEMGKRRSQSENGGIDGSFQWPEDIF